MQFNSRKHLTELVQVDKYLEANPRCPILTNRRRFVYLVYEAADRSFVECQAAIKITGHWYVWPQGLQNYVERQIERTLRQHAA